MRCGAKIETRYQAEPFSNCFRFVVDEAVFVGVCFETLSLIHLAIAMRIRVGLSQVFWCFGIPGKFQALAKTRQAG